MKSTRRLLSILLCLVMCLSLLPTAFAADDALVSSGFAGPGATFKLYSSGKLVINGTGVPVADMAQWSFADNPSYVWTADDILATRSAIKELVIEEGIIALADDVFHDCPNLTRVSLPDSLTFIADGAFMNCSGLKAITIPSGVTWIGVEAFKGCVSLADLLFTKSVREIGESAFEDCTKLGSVTFPAGASVIGDRAFANCKALKTIAFLGSFEDNSSPSFGVYLDASEEAFLNVKADVYYPVDNASWNNIVNPMNTYNDFGGRLTWKAATAQTSSEGWVLKPGGWYYYVGGEMITSNWKAYGGKWFYFGADGRMLTGLQQINGNYYYFGQGESVDGYPLGARVSGLVKKANGTDDYFFDENGVWQPSYSGVDDDGIEYMKNGWQKVYDRDDTDGTKYKWYYIRNKAKVTGWLWSNGYWYYLDPTTGAMVTGWLTWKGNTYYLRPLDKAREDGIPSKEGSMIAGRSATIGGTVYTFDKSGALVGGKMEDNPMGIATGFQNEGSAAMPDWKFYGSDGKKATGWLLLDGNWYYFDSKGTMQTGWKKIKGAWYYLTKWAPSGDEDVPTNWYEITDPTDKSTDPYFAGRMVTGFNKIPYTKNGVNTVKTYYFKPSGALNGKGWIKVGIKWYHLEEDGVVNTGWFRDGTKWYYLDPTSNPIGEMVTGYVTTLADNTTTIKDPSGADNGGESFKASGEWIGSGELVTATKSGAWKKHGNYWYYYDANGDDYNYGNFNAVTGWQEIKGKWYYLSPTGSTDPNNPPCVGYMYTGFQEIDGEKYFFDMKNGNALGGWQKIDGVFYYFYPKHDGTFGKMLKGWNYINNNWYYMNDTTGALQDGWYQVTSDDIGAKEQGFAPGWYLLNPDTSSSTYGAMQKGGWKQLNGKWYYFHNEHDGAYGKLEQGKWIEGKGGKLYYVKASTNPAESWMVTGIQTLPDGKTYLFGSDGKLQDPDGWKKVGDKWYFFSYDSTAADGAGAQVAKTGWITDGDKYYADENGVMKTGLQTIDGKKYYFNSDGALQKGWQTVGGKKYYFDSSTTPTGQAVTGQEKAISGNTYLFDDEGVMQTGFQETGGKTYYYGTDGVKQALTGIQTIDGKKYYFDSSNAVQTGWQTVDGKDYYFDSSTSPSGQAVTGKTDIGGDTYFFDDDGVKQTACWQTISDKTYRFNGEGKMIKGTMATIDSKTYYFHDDGARAEEELVEYTDGETYGFDEDGAMIVNDSHEFDGEMWYFDNQGHGGKV